MKVKSQVIKMGSTEEFLTRQEWYNNLVIKSLFLLVPRKGWAWNYGNVRFTCWIDWYFTSLECEVQHLNMQLFYSLSYFQPELKNLGFFHLWNRFMTIINFWVKFNIARCPCTFNVSSWSDLDMWIHNMIFLLLITVPQLLTRISGENLYMGMELSQLST